MLQVLLKEAGRAVSVLLPAVTGYAAACLLIHLTKRVADIL
jgi:hypothetical protein